MAQKIYYTRHGQTTWNVEKKICGTVDVPLTDLGRKQAEELAQEIIDKKIHIDIIYCSPLIRAYDTARIVSDRIGVPVKPLEELKEASFGAYEGTPIMQDIFLTAKKTFVYSFKGGESGMRIIQRMYNLLDKLRDDDTYENCLLIAHNGLARAVHSYFHDMTNEEYDGYNLKNCEIKAYDFSSLE